MSVLAPRSKRGYGKGLSSRQRALGAYLGLAVGDALGATVEFMPPLEIRRRYTLHRHIRGGGWLGLQPGQVTDDTTMSLALGEAILNHGSVDATIAAQAFDAWMRAKPVDIGNTVRRGIMHFRRTGNPENLLSEHDAGNGACMRCLPVALLSVYSGTDYVAMNKAQAHVTHHNPISDAACECVIAMIHGAFKHQSLQDQRQGPVQTLLDKYSGFGFEQDRVTTPSAYVVDTLRAVFQALFENDDFETALVDVVNRGGDADTTGAILGMITGAYYGVEAIPKQWLARLDRAVKQTCESQALALLALASAIKVDQD